MYKKRRNSRVNSQFRRLREPLLGNRFDRPVRHFRDTLEFVVVEKFELSQKWRPVGD